MNDQDIYSGIFGSGVGLSLAPRSNVSGATFSGDGVTKTFTFPNTEPIISTNPNSYDIIIYGVGQVPVNDYSVDVDSNSITFNDAPPSGTDNVYVRIITQAVSETESAAVAVNGYLTAKPEATPVPKFTGIGGPFNDQAQALLNNMALAAGNVQVASYEGLRAYTGPASAVTVTGYLVTAKPAGIYGMFVVDASDTTSSDNGGTIIVDTLGRRWKRPYQGEIKTSWFDAAIDGTDTFIKVQAAIDAVNSMGGGKVLFAAGRYGINGTLTLYSKVELVGESSAATRLVQLNPAVSLIKSYQFDTLTGTSSTGGIRRAALKGLTLEASLSAGLPTGALTQHGVQIYGYGNEIDDVHIRYFGGNGYYSEWRTPGVAPDSGYEDGFVEDRIGRLKCYQNGLSGIVKDGAHDGQWGRVISYSNNLKDTSADKPNVWIKSKGNPQYIDQLHAWGATSAVALLVEGAVKLSNCAIEGATDAQIRIKTGEVEIQGGEIFVPGAGSSAKGIQFIGGTGVCTGYKINTVIRGCNGGSIDFGTGIDAAEIKARIYQTSGTIFLGVMPTAGVGNSLEFTAAGGADNRGGTKKRHYHGTFSNLSLVDVNNDGLEYTQHGGEGVIAFPQRKTEPVGSYYPPSGVLGYGRVNSLKFHQSSSNTIGAIMGEPASPVTPIDNLDCSNYQLISLAAAGSAVTITNLVGGLNGSPFFILMPSGGAEITLVNGTGNIRTKAGTNITRTGLGSNRLVSFVKARDGNYYQV